MAPKVLMGLMPTHEGSGLTTEHIKSHLQKFRLRHERSKEEFLEDFHDHLRIPIEESTVVAPAEESHGSADDSNQCSMDRREAHQQALAEEEALLHEVKELHVQLLQYQLKLQAMLATSTPRGSGLHHKATHTGHRDGGAVAALPLLHHDQQCAVCSRVAT